MGHAPRRAVLTRVVPPPEPFDIVELPVIHRLLPEGCVLIAAGDSMTAGMVAGLAHREDVEGALRLGATVSHTPRHGATATPRLWWPSTQP
ncbi:MAG: hypothetical protein JWL99_2548 [Streptomyces oryziradicis]|nr:hypothetical protein [Actinacidiphila oryziradicis]